MLKIVTFFGDIFAYHCQLQEKCQNGFKNFFHIYQAKRTRQKKQKTNKKYQINIEKKTINKTKQNVKMRRLDK